MNMKAYFTEKLSEVFFIQIKKEKLNEIFNVQIQEEIYLPIISKEIIEKTKEGEDFSNISIMLLVEGMFYVLGADEKFEFSSQYKKLLWGNVNFTNFIKKDIFDKIKGEIDDTAYILLKGLNMLEENVENYKKLLSVADYLRYKNSFFKEEEIEIIQKGKSLFHLAEIYYYESIIKNEEGDYEGALFSMHNYISNGGIETKEIKEFTSSLKKMSDLHIGKEAAYDDPEKALKLLLPLIKEYEDNTELYYYIAVCYRQLHNYEKAIYYLNETLSIDSGFVDVFNEMGINYAYLEEYETAIKYLKKAFEATKSVEICTNIAMCYMNMGKTQEAKAHLDIAEKLSPKDEIVLKIKKKLN